MISLHHYNNRLINNAGNDYLRIDYNFFNQSRISDLGMVRFKFLDHALLPYLMNNIEIKQLTYMYDHVYTDIDYLPAIVANLKGHAIADTTELSILRMFTTLEDMDSISATLDSDVWVEVPDAIKTLYNTCVKQIELREGYTRSLGIRVFKSKINHTVLMLMNFDDSSQASEMFLTIGVIPLLFEDYKEKMCTEELEYFSTLVKRSQVKRISNVAATAAFNILTCCKKYIDLLRKETTKYVISNIMRTRIDLCRNIVSQTERDAENYLRNYEDLLAKYYKANKELQELQEGKDAVLDEVKTAISIPAIYKVDMDRQDQFGIEITIITPCSFFELDEVECIMHNINEDTVFYKFINDVFITQKYKLYLGHTFRYNFNPDYRFSANNVLNMDELKEMDCMFNPHLFYFNCFGDYKPKLIQAMQQQDLTMFINWAIASLKSINFKDGAVINRWKQYFTDLEEAWESGSGISRLLANSKCLEDENGNRLSLADVYLHAEETEDNEEIDLEEL